MITLTINGQNIETENGSTVLQAASKANIHIPTLCFLPEVQAIGACRVCLVEVEGMGNLQAACVFPATEGLKVHTNTEKVRKARKFSVEMLPSNHSMDCLTCARNLNCELQKIAHELGVSEIRFTGVKSKGGIDDSSPSIRRDNGKCILCRRCVTVCENVQSVNALSLQGRGFETRVEAAFGNGLGDVACANCGQCTLVCPVGAITEKDDTEGVWDAISDPSKFVIIQDAP
ncbi:MAG: 2Fe-2S iron-sulfur cluster-binding protein, partial [Deltaproteobacteria bacterium]